MCTFIDEHTCSKVAATLSHRDRSGIGACSLLTVGGCLRLVDNLCNLFGVNSDNSFSLRNRTFVLSAHANRIFGYIDFSLIYDSLKQFCRSVVEKSISVHMIRRMMQLGAWSFVSDALVTKGDMADAVTEKSSVTS